MLKSHAQILLKAVDYWKLRFDEKYEEWAANLEVTDHASYLRALLKAGKISPGEAASGVVVEDDGYHSDYDSDNS